LISATTGGAFFFSIKAPVSSKPCGTSNQLQEGNFELVRSGRPSHLASSVRAHFNLRSSH
jgi:hypothetical protein